MSAVIGLFKKKKKAAAEAETTPAEDKKGPIITALENLPADSPLRKRLGSKGGAASQAMATILGGQNGQLGA